jgi:hypothetical protein
MKKTTVVDRLLANMEGIHELGRQRAFELGNPFYALFDEDGGYYRKELPNGEKYLVEVEVILDEHDLPAGIKDSVIRKLD